MSASTPSQRWQPLPASSLVDVLTEDEDIEDVAALSAADLPGWLEGLSIPTGWQRLVLPDQPEPPVARIAVHGPRGNGEWEAAETISVFGYTGWPVFYDVFHNADRMLRGLNAAGIAVKVLPVPRIQRTAAIRSTGAAVIGDRSVWIQQSHYVSGSEQPHASRLIVHSLFVETACRARLTEDIARLSDAVYQGFIAAIVKECGIA
ncbi:hypothetical protein [Mycobacterium sp. 852002-51057_SCH5723018]|uniref:hypothetical protein n=1 Tax=Mycobacterium sp. 852002-51057_SCH5723018 TaxID=1834094 RepID=UPI00080178CD|nr:hypothetical protein [Mycobacterium sp. 852002-51057_SCH5723018]OBG28971.1 hypothetical protein A5764_23685 [Mycobacterium sp. 852002-51057_SCH5723018]